MSKKRDIKKGQYYVWYLGWKECRGVWGREFTEPIVRQLIHRRSHETLPKLTVEVSRKELKIVQLVEKKKGKTEKIKYPAIPAKDVTYAVQALSPDEDVVGCIYLGYNPQTRCAVHVHVYRCDSAETAAIFVDHLNQLIDIPEHQQRVQRIEGELAAKGQVVPRPSDIRIMGPDSEEARKSTEVRTDSSNIELPEGKKGDYGTATSPITQEQQEFKETAIIYDTLAAELKERLTSKDKSPILLPPKDYDTVHRNVGNLMEIERRKSLNINIVGPQGAVIKKTFHRQSSGADSAKGDSDETGSQKDSRASRTSHGSDREETNGGSPRNSGNERSSWHDTNGREGYPRNDINGREGYLSAVPPNGHSKLLDVHDDRSRGSRNSRGSNISNYDEEEELVAISPNWKMQHPQTFIPPSSPRNHSPYPIIVDPRRQHERPASPGYHARPMSPPPELKENTYFPGTGTLPNYLPGDHVIYGRMPSPNPGARHHDMGPIYTSHSLDSEPIYSSGKKYTASSLGLLERGPQGKNRSRDEGYTSLERLRGASPIPGYPRDRDHGDIYGPDVIYPAHPEYGRYRDMQRGMDPYSQYPAPDPRYTRGFPGDAGEYIADYGMRGPPMRSAYP